MDRPNIESFNLWPIYVCMFLSMCARKLFYFCCGISRMRVVAMERSFLFPFFFFSRPARCVVSRERLYTINNTWKWIFFSVSLAIGWLLDIERAFVQLLRWLATYLTTFSIRSAYIVAVESAKQKIFCSRTYEIVCIWNIYHSNIDCRHDATQTTLHSTHVICTLYTLSIHSRHCLDV